MDASSHEPPTALAFWWWQGRGEEHWIIQTPRGGLLFLRLGCSSLLVLEVLPEEGKSGRAWRYETQAVCSGAAALNRARSPFIVPLLASLGTLC